MFERFLARVGWSYDVVCDGQAALDLTVSKSYDVVITDLKMPGLSGLELFRLVRRQNPHQAVIVVSGTGNVSDMLELLREGVADIIPKPIDFDSVERCINRIVSSAREDGNEGLLYKSVAAECSTFVLTSCQLSSGKIPFLLAQKLFLGGKLDLNTKLRLELAFQEALTNAFEHGNLELDSTLKEVVNQEGIDQYSLLRRQRLADPQFAGRIVKLTTGYDSTKVWVTIRDQGKGFNPPRHERQEADPITHGRGLPIIYSLMDEVAFDAGGTQITFSKKIG